MQNFATAQGTFPPGVKAKAAFSSDFATNGAYEWTYFLHLILPDMEQSGFYSAVKGPTFNISNPWDPAATASWIANGADRLPVPGWLCPSDGLGTAFSLVVSSPQLRLAKTNYLGIFSGQSNDDSIRVPEPKEQAVFRVGIGTPLSEIRDGTSNTMAVVEYLTGLDENDLRGFPWSNQAGLQFLQVKLGPNSIGDDIIYTGFCPANYDQPSQNLPCTGTTDGTQSYAGSRSRHPGGVNVVYCDGSVHFIPDGVDNEVWWNLGWIDDGNPPEGDF